MGIRVILGIHFFTVFIFLYVKSCHVAVKAYIERIVIK